MRQKRVYQNLPEMIADELREKILSGEMEVGMRLKQQALAKMFETSLIPVREAFTKLEREGLITIYPNKGAVVRELSGIELKNQFETRAILEAGALEKSVLNLSISDLEDARACIQKLDTAQDGRVLSQLNKELHSILYKGCENKYLLDMIDNHYKNIERHMQGYLIGKENNALSQKYHWKIFYAIKEKNVEKAVMLLKEHMDIAMQALIQKISNT